MPDLIAQGPQTEQRWRRKLVPGACYTIGRQAESWSTPWDDRISRQHVEVVYRDGSLHVKTLAAARNPVFFRGVSAASFRLSIGEHFVIGQTTFSLVDQRVNVSIDLPYPADERTFSIEELHSRPFHQSDKRIDALARLPEIIRGSASDQELFVRLVNLLLSGVERATAAAVVAVQEGSGFGVQGSELNIVPAPRLYRPEAAPADAGPADAVPADAAEETIHVLHWDRRILAEADFRPSQRLISQAVACQESIAHVWSGKSERGSEFTLSEGVDWALCVPVPGSACRGWALYVTGSFSGKLPSAPPAAEQLRDDVKFTELTATSLSGLREARLLAARQASLSNFLSPIVVEAIQAEDPERVLAPREADVTVLFCDLRGFTSESERHASDLFGLLNRVSQALGIMTRNILDQGGVVGDFHGDAAMGFWGWPIAQPDAVLRACRAALGIRAAFQSATGEAADFRVGIGIASGRAVAGKIGTADQVKVTAFGPVVNLAARLETMTRQLQTSILIDPATAAIIRASIPQNVCRVRRLARVRPLGLAAPIEVSELLPPESEPDQLTQPQLDAYHAALEAFESRDWQLAIKRLHALPPDDIAKDFLTLFIARHGRRAPGDWDGAIPLESK